jgi:choline dehydrogenase
MTPQSRGALTLRSADPLREPRIEHNYVSDPEGHDRAVLREGVKIARNLATQPELRDLLGEELAPGPKINDDRVIDTWIDSAVEHYYHPVGTCAMGLEGETEAVTDSRGRILGLRNAYVADCSIIPVIPRANTNVPAVVVGERMASWLLEAS